MPLTNTRHQTHVWLPKGASSDLGPEAQWDDPGGNGAAGPLVRPAGGGAWSGDEGGGGPVSELPGVDNNNNNDDASPMSLYTIMLRPTSMLMDRMIAPINVHRITHYWLTATSYIYRSIKISFLKKEGVKKKISYERRVYESVDDQSLS